jgi:hypothetical protein
MRARQVGFGLTRLPALTPPGDVRPVLFAGAKAFFERRPFVLENTPERIVAHPEAAVGQLAEQSSQREIRLLGDPRKNPVPFTRHKIRPAAAHLQRRRTADGAQARLYRKGPGKEAKLCSIRHALMENRNGFVVDAGLTEANGHAERVAALHLIEPRASRPRRSRSAPTRPTTPRTSSMNRAR